jgi:hypothetical protein
MRALLVLCAAALLFLTACDQPKGLPGYGSGNEQVRYIFSAGETATGSTVAQMRAYVTSRVQAMPEEDTLDAAVYGGQISASQGHVRMMWGSYLPATSGNKHSATTWLNGANTNPGDVGGGIAYTGWQRAFQTSLPGTRMVFIINDIGTSGNDILQDLPVWRSMYAGRTVELRVFNPDAATEHFATQAQAYLDTVVIQ